MENPNLAQSKANPPPFSQTYRLEDLGPQAVQAFLLHGVVFFNCNDDEKLLKDSKKCWTVMDDFFALPEEEKSAFTTAQPIGDTGYNLQISMKEQYQIRYGEGINHPDKIRGTTFKHIFNRLEKLCQKMLQTIFPNENQSLVDLMDPPPKSRNDAYTTSSVLTFNHYFNSAGSRELPCSEHADGGLITLALLPSEGLQFCDLVTEKWIDVSECLGGVPRFALFGGETLAALSGRSNLATMHRVTNTSSARMSVIFKLRGRPAIVGPRSDADYGIAIAQNRWFEAAGNESEPHSSNLPVNLLVEIFSHVESGQRLAMCGQVNKDWYFASKNLRLWRFFAMSEFHVIAAGPNIDWKQIYIERASGGEKKDKKVLETASDASYPPSAEERIMLRAEERPRLPQEALDRIQELAQATLNRNNVPPNLKGVPAMTSVKIVMVGDGSTGKTCSLIAFTSTEFPMLYVPTVFGEYSANMRVRGVPITLSLWDTAGQEEYDRLRPLSYPQTDIFLLCFAVNSRSTFDNIESKWIPELRKHEPNVPIVLVATKIDYRHTSDHGYVEMVQPEEGAHLCERLNLRGYLEISAKAGVGLQELFDVAVLVGLEARTPHSSRRRCVIQ